MDCLCITHWNHHFVNFHQISDLLTILYSTWSSFDSSIHKQIKLESTVLKGVTQVIHMLGRQYIYGNWCTLFGGSNSSGANLQCPPRRNCVDYTVCCSFFFYSVPWVLVLDWVFSSLMLLNKEWSLLRWCHQHARKTVLGANVGSHVNYSIFYLQTQTKWLHVQHNEKCTTTYSVLEFTITK